MSSKIRVAIVGLGFGSEFIDIYKDHPEAEMYAICRRDKAGLDACGEKFDVSKRYTSYEDLLKDKNVDAVHINSPIAEHAIQAIAALEAGKHVACTVPMATNVEDCRKICELQKKTGKVLRVLTGKNRVVVEGVNRVWKHVKPSQRNPQGGRIQKEAAIHISNVMPLDPGTGKGTRVKMVMKNNVKHRVAVKSGTDLGRTGKK